MKKLVIFGNTIVAKLAHHYFSRDSEYKVEAFTVDPAYLLETSLWGLPVVSFANLNETHPVSDYFVFIAIGPNKMNALRAEKFFEAKAKGYRFASYVSPHAVCNSKLGENTLVADGAIINPFVEMGHNNCFWEFSLISNDCVIRNHCYFSPKSVISSFSEIKDNSIIGTGSIVKARVTVAEKTLVGAGCYISKDTEVSGVYGEKSSSLLGCISEKIDISL
jgi:sugar O-acyltransferase (sialic acid O-acetyltransferase NeuD family)